MSLICFDEICIEDVKQLKNTVFVMVERMPSDKNLWSVWINKETLRHFEPWLDAVSVVLFTEASWDNFIRFRRDNIYSIPYSSLHDRLLKGIFLTPQEMALFLKGVCVYLLGLYTLFREKKRKKKGKKVFSTEIKHGFVCLKLPLRQGLKSGNR